MKIYLAVSTADIFSLMVRCGVENILVSYFYIIKSKKFHEVIKQSKEANSNLSIMLDSGAHSIQTVGKKQNYNAFFKEYVKYLKKYSYLYDQFVELDIENVVGLKIVEVYRKILEKYIGNPIVVWHCMRGWDYWLHMIKKYKYVGFSGFIRKGKKEVPIDYIGKFLNAAKQNGTKTHGFGITSPKMLNRFNWDSVDSSSWLQQARTGSVSVPSNIVDKCHCKNLSRIVVSNKQLSNKDHIRALPKFVRAKIIDYLKEIGQSYFGDKSRFDLSCISTDYKSRFEVNLIYYMKLQKEINDRKKEVRLNTLV